MVDKIVQDDETAWIPPQPNATAVQRDLLMAFLDNASHELICLVNQRSHLEKTRHSEEINFLPAHDFFSQLMGALKCKKYTSAYFRLDDKPAYSL